MVRKNASDRLCVGGRGNVSSDRLGNLDDFIAAEAAERGDTLRLPQNKRAVKDDPRLVIRIGLPAEEE